MTSGLTDEERRQLDLVVDALMTWRGDGTQAWNDLITGVERILTDREAAAERRGAVNTLREAADEMDNTDDPDAIYVDNGDIDLWLRARADRIEASDARPTRRIPHPQRRLHGPHDHPHWATRRRAQHRQTHARDRRDRCRPARAGRAEAVDPPHSFEPGLWPGSLLSGDRT
jgi:hypothetical protein